MIGRQRACGQLALVILTSAVLTGCKSRPPPAPAALPPPPPIVATVTIAVAADVNPNRSGRPSPVFLRIYQLRDAAKFQNGEYEDLTERSDQVLATTLVSRDERMMEPGMTTTLNIPVAPETRMLGVIAEYRELANSQWRAISPAPAGGLLTLFKDRSLMIHVNREGVSISVIAHVKGSV